MEELITFAKEIGTFIIDIGLAPILVLSIIIFGIALKRWVLKKSTKVLPLSIFIFGAIIGIINVIGMGKNRMEWMINILGYGTIPIGIYMLWEKYIGSKKK